MPRDLATRIAVFYCFSALSGAFSGLLAAGIAKMDGVGGYEGWRWIFLLEGLVTVVLGVLCFFLLIDSPQLSGKWLTQDEIRYLELQHFIKDGGEFKDERKKTSWKDISAVLSNWKMYLLAYILLCQSACSYGLSAIYPTIAFSLTNPNAQRYQIYPPYLDERHGLQGHQCPAHDRPAVRGRSHLRHLLFGPVRSLLLAHAVRGDSAAADCNRILHHPRPQG